MIRSLKNGNFYGKSINLKVGSRINQKLPRNQTNHSINHINIATFLTFIVLKKQVILLEENNFYSPKSWRLKVETEPENRSYWLMNSNVSDAPA